MTDQRDHPTAGRRRRHKSPPIPPHMHDLPFPTLLDHMGAEDGPSCSEEEKDAKCLRSPSTTPRSAMSTQPNDYDRVMGATSVGSQESVRFGEEMTRNLRMSQIELLTARRILTRLVMEKQYTMMLTLALTRFKEDLVVRH